jgi:hypothetical protein
MSLIGVVLLLAALVYGRPCRRHPALAAYFDLSGPTLALIIIGYGFVASVLPVWLLLAPRDYLSTFLKIGTILLLAIGDHHRAPRSADAGGHQVHRRHRSGVGRQPVPVPVHHHRLRRGVRLARADRLRHHAEDDREREPDPRSSATARC